MSDKSSHVKPCVTNVFARDTCTGLYCSAVFAILGNTAEPQLARYAANGRCTGNATAVLRVGDKSGCPATACNASHEGSACIDIALVSATCNRDGSLVGNITYESAYLISVCIDISPVDNVSDRRAVMRLTYQGTRVSRRSDTAFNNKVADASVKSAEKTEGKLHRLFLKSDGMIIAVVICAERKPSGPLVIGILDIAANGLPVTCGKINVYSLLKEDA